MLPFKRHPFLVVLLSLWSFQTIGIGNSYIQCVPNTWPIEYCDSIFSITPRWYRLWCNCDITLYLSSTIVELLIIVQHTYVWDLYISYIMCESVLPAMRNSMIYGLKRSYCEHYIIVNIIISNCLFCRESVRCIGRKI